MAAIPDLIYQQTWNMDGKASAGSSTGIERIGPDGDMGEGGKCDQELADSTTKSYHCRSKPRKASRRASGSVSATRNNTYNLPRGDTANAHDNSDLDLEENLIAKNPSTPVERDNLDREKPLGSLHRKTHSFSKLLIQDPSEAFSVGPPKTERTKVSLSEKIRVPSKTPKAPGGLYFTCGKLAKEANTLRFASDINGVKNTEIPLAKPTTAYNPLLDPHLEGFFQKPGMLNHLYKAGVVNEYGRVICRVKDLNDMRSQVDYLHRKGVYDLREIEKEKHKDDPKPPKPVTLKAILKLQNQISKFERRQAYQFPYAYAKVDLAERRVELEKDRQMRKLIESAELLIERSIQGENRRKKVKVTLREGKKKEEQRKAAIIDKIKAKERAFEDRMNNYYENYLLEKEKKSAQAKLKPKVGKLSSSPPKSGTTQVGSKKKGRKPRDPWND